MRRFAMIVVLASCTAGASGQSGSERPAVAIEMRGVHLRVAEGIALDIAHLKGRLVGRSNATPVFDDGTSYTLALDAAEISIDQPSMNALVVRALTAARSSLTDVRVSFDGPFLKQTGTLRRVLPVPFTVRSRVEATDDGRLRLRPVRVKAVGMPVGGLMKAVGLELDELLKLAPGSGVEVADNDLLLTPGRVLPPPGIDGRVRTVSVRGNRLVQQWGSARALERLRAGARRGHYVQFRGNRIQFGRLTMSDTDMRLIDADPKDPFDFYPAKYVAQLVAGYSKNTPTGALRVFMPDYDDVTRRPVSLRPRSYRR